MREPFPLQWPESWPRTPDAKRTASRFGHRGQVLFSTALRDLRLELGRLGAANAAITTDLPVRHNGEPYATATGRVDPGVAVWFMLPSNKPGTIGVMQERVIACDRWRTHAENMVAIAKTIEAMRGLERWGAADVMHRAFAGFTALPAGPAPARTWREVIGGSWPAGLAPAEVLAIAKARHRAAISSAHPDAGGDHASAAELNAALDAAEAELGNG